MADWNLNKRKNACVDCDREFEDGESYFSVLTLDAASLGREDHCLSCFQDREQPDPAREPIWWRTRHVEDKKKSLAVDFEAVEALFLALDGQEDERLKELRYLLSLLLMRKRRLKLVRVRRHAKGEAMVVRRPRRQEEQEVDVFDLTSERMDALRLELERIVEGAGAEDVLAGPPDPKVPEGEEEAESGAAEGEEELVEEKPS